MISNKNIILNLTNYILFIIILFYSATLYSHSPERSVKPVATHGGIAKRLGDYNLEIVKQYKCVLIYVDSISNAKISSSNSSAVVEMYVKGENPVIKLLPNGDNQLYGCANDDINDAKMAKIQLKMYGKSPIKKLLVLKRKLIK